MLVLTLLTACGKPQPDHRGDHGPRFVAPAPVAPGSKRVALVLGGGGPRGVAHIGVLKALEANGVKPDLIVGVSAGAFAGALAASGMPVRKLEELALALGATDVLDVTFPKRGYIRGERLADLVNQLVDKKPIERFPISFAAIAARLPGGERVIFNAGDAGLAVRASCTIPGRFQPPKINGIEYVDGDLVGPVPVRAARELGATVVIAVDVSAYLEDTPMENSFPVDWIVEGVMRKALTDSEAPYADVFIHPNLDYYAGWSLAYKQESIRRAEAETLKHMARILELVR